MSASSKTLVVEGSYELGDLVGERMDWPPFLFGQRDNRHINTLNMPVNAATAEGSQAGQSDALLRQMPKQGNNEEEMSIQVWERLPALPRWVPSPIRP